ncbi:MAG TPA: hypothetical protein VHT03_09920 [Rhizomicrobium sp.]|jgi:hypothetical protein|nr:hypothetical protein [Rhizomicrobium sp.]
MSDPAGTRAILGLGLVFLVTALASTAPARAERCFANGDVVGFDGIATPGPIAREWVLHLSQPACVESREVSAIRIIGIPPPLGIPLELTGKLMLGRGKSQSAMFVALVVSHGRRLGAAPSVAPPRQSQTVQSVATRCSTPPYGGTESEYRGFVRRFGAIIKPEKILAGICNAKFGSAPRDGLHKLGFSNAQIESESTEHLAADTMTALKHLVNTIE